LANWFGYVRLRKLIAIAMSEDASRD